MTFQHNKQFYYLMGANCGKAIMVYDMDQKFVCEFANEGISLENTIELAKVVIEAVARLEARKAESQAQFQVETIAAEMQAQAA